MEILLTFLAAVTFALAHFFAGEWRFLDVAPRSRWLSFASGVSVAYVFLHILPALPEAQEAVANSFGGFLFYLERHVYLVALVGLLTFFGLERAVKNHRQRKDRKKEPTEAGIFWVHVGAFAAYNFLIGYLLLHREQVGESGPDYRGLLFFSVAMLMHFAVNDYALWQHHKHMYQREGRWILGFAVLAGWGVGAATTLPDAIVSIPFAFIAGAVILNVLKEELPEERGGHFYSFLLGTAGYAVLLMLLG